MQPSSRTDGATLVAPQQQLRGKHALSLFELTLNDEGNLAATTRIRSLPFRMEEYSQFKYGRISFARQYAAALAYLIGAHVLPVTKTNEQIVVLGTPHKRLPNAARMLAIEAERLLRHTGFASSYTYIHQHLLAAGDYGRLSVEQRDERNRRKQRSRFLDPDDFVGKHVVLVDDVRITGSIERSVLDLLLEVEVLSMTIANLVKLDPDAARTQPQLEDKLNHAAVRNITDIHRLMTTPQDFVLTTRAVKFILESHPIEVRWLLDRLNREQTMQLYYGVVDEGYDRMPAYQQTFNLISTELD